MEKDIALETGAIAQCWVIADKKEIVYRQQTMEDAETSINPSDYVQTGSVVLIGYHNVAFCKAGKCPMWKSKMVSLGNLDDYKHITLESLSEYVNIYNACQAVCLNQVTATEEFSGAILKNSDDA